jgi:hypothetical protein
LSIKNSLFPEGEWNAGVVSDVELLYYHVEMLRLFENLVNFRALHPNSPRFVPGKGPIFGTRSNIFEARNPRQSVSHAAY